MNDDTNATDDDLYDGLSDRRLWQLPDSVLVTAWSAVRSIRVCARLAVLMVMLLLSPRVFADVTIATGPTTIPRGDAQGAKDITVSNDLFAVAFAVDSSPPWGRPRGGIVDVAIVSDGMPGYDIVSFVDFLPNSWAGWTSSKHRVRVSTHTSTEVVIESIRDWSFVELKTLFTIRDGDSKIHVATTMTNKGDDALTNLLSGYGVWPDGGFLFQVPGMFGVEEGDESQASADWSASYDANWTLGLHAPFADHNSYSGRDRYLAHEMQPGDTRTFDAWVQIESSGDLAPLVSSEIAMNSLSYGDVQGRVVSADGGPIGKPAIVVYKNGQPYTWAMGIAGRYSVSLPVGEYSIYATAADYSESAAAAVLVRDGTVLEQDFDDLRSPGELHIRVIAEGGDEPVDARISIEEGYIPLIEYLGRQVFFTELNPRGELILSVAPGDYTFRIATSDGFTARSKLEKATISSGKRLKLTAGLKIESAPSAQGWYSADLHHHSDVLDGFTPPEFVIRSELAAGLDITFLSDHDSVINNEQMRRLAANRGRHFISATEMSPSWGHFNAYPLDDGKEPELEMATASVQQVFAEARRLGADILAVNHPYADDGYFANLEQSDVVPGGYDEHFDLIEIGDGDSQQTAERAWQFWNQGKRAYFAAGSDVHDVWSAVSGSARSYVHVSGELTVKKFIDSLQNGHSYASQGPLIYPELMFGSDIRHNLGDDLTLVYSLYAVNGLKSAHLIENGVDVQRSGFADNTWKSPLQFTVSPLADTWYSLVVVDTEGRRAYSNPVWISVTE